MGLDMYFYSVPKGQEPSEGKGEEIFYFRKHSDLHGWLEKQWHENLGRSEEFNCVYMEITPDILSRLKDYLNNPAKEKCRGFFWGESTEENWRETRELIPRLEEIINSGDRVFYYSWW